MSVQTPTAPVRGNGVVLTTRIIGVITLLAASVFIGLYGTRFERWSDVLAITTALICAAIAARLMAESFDPVILARSMCVEGEATEKERRQARLQALLVLALGVVIGWPPLAAFIHMPSPAWTSFIVVAFVALRLWHTNWAFKNSDEFQRQGVRNAAWRSYFVGQTGLIAYACCERLGLVPTLTAWDVLVVMTFVSTLMPVVNVRVKVQGVGGLS